MKPINILQSLCEREEIETNHKSFKHVDDVWDYLEASTSEEDLNNRIDEVPRSFGTVSYDLHEDGNGATVLIDYDDGNETYYEKVDVYFNELDESAQPLNKEKYFNLMDAVDELIISVNGNKEQLKDVLKEVTDMFNKAINDGE